MQRIRITNVTLSKAGQRFGGMLVLICAMMLIFMVFVAFAVDVAHMHLARTELRSATDAAAKAAAQELSRTQNVAAAIRVGSEVAAANTVNNTPLALAGSSFTFGRAVEGDANGRFLFAPARSPINSVRVVGSRTQGSRSGAVPLFFGNVFGVPFFEPESTATATFLDRDVVLVVDRSGSMLGTKFADLRAAIGLFVATLAETPVDEFVGLASYSSFASADVALTANHPQITAALAAMPVEGFTSISRGIDAGEAVLRTGRSREFVERTMIVMTDGNHNTGIEPRIPARRVAADGVVIHTITFGFDADISRMREVATIGRGRHFHANNGAELQRIYREIALSLSTMITQ
jgi:Ca-activated chloride channel homolog